MTRFWKTDEYITVKVDCGTIKTTHKSNVKEYSEVWFDEGSITNIWALKNIKRKFRVTYSRNDNEVFTVYKPNFQDVHFNIHKDILH